MEQDTIRINKALARSGLCSRRKADELLAQSRVTVNGLIATPGLLVNPQQDRIEVDGKPLRAAPGTTCCLMLHKPIQVVCTAKDPEGRQTVLDLVPDMWKSHRLYPAGRLDFFSEGLVLLTDDGELTNHIVHPRHHLPRVYHVLIRGKVPSQALDTMQHGMTLQEGDKLAPAEVRVLSESPYIPPQRALQGTILEMTLHQGLNRQIRRMCRDLDLTVLRLIRVAQGPLRLGTLLPGMVRELSPDEICALRQASGMDAGPEADQKRFRPTQNYGQKNKRRT